MATITLTNIQFSESPVHSQVVHMSVRRASDPDVPASYTAAPDALVDVSGVIVDPDPYTITVPSVNMVVKAVNACGTDSYQTTFITCAPVTALGGSIEGQCADGYTLSDDGTYCYMLDIQAATCPGGDPTTACHYTNVGYTSFGTIIFKPSGYNVDGTPIGGFDPIRYDITTGYTGKVWRNTAGNIYDGRLNKAGIWSCDDSTLVGTLGYSRNITIPTTGLYYIGVGADNTASIKVNGATVLDQDATAIGTAFSTDAQATFKYWLVYPVNLNAGINLVEVTGTNVGSVGIIGFEIYNATESQLTVGLTESQLTAYTIYSTKPYIGSVVKHLGTGTITPGSGYGLDGIYTGVSLINGAGTGATADISIVSGIVANVKPVAPGSGYLLGDTLSAASGDIGGGSGFSFVTAVTGGDVADGDEFTIGNCNCDAYSGYTLVYNEDALEYQCQKLLTQSPT